MRIIQLIDSLEAGGAERMAVYYANALVNKIEFSGLVATRFEGQLKSTMHSNVSYLFLKKTKTIDFTATKKLLTYCKKNQIHYIHAHSSSFFLAVLIKILIPNLKIIWHLHNGNIQNDSFVNKSIYLVFSKFINCIISVNKAIDYWVSENKLSKKHIYLENFSKIDLSVKETILHSEDSFKILQLANLRHPKNHLFTIEIAHRVVSKYPNVTFHLVGYYFEDDYYKALKNKIEHYHLQQNVFIYGSKPDTNFIVSQADVCILTSQSEGLPISLIEYGLNKKPVVCTSVGEIPTIINKNNGYLVAVDDVENFSKALIKLIENVNLRQELGESLYNTMTETYSQEVVIQKYLNFINS